MTALRGIYAALLTSQSSGRSSEQAGTASDEALRMLVVAQSDAANSPQTAEPARQLMGVLHELWSPKTTRLTTDTLFVDALGLVQDLTSRVGDESKLAIDPELASYYLQQIIVRRLPAIMVELGKTQALVQTEARALTLSFERRERVAILKGLLRSVTAAVKDDLAAAHQGDVGGTLVGVIDVDIAAMVLSMGLYLNALDASRTHGQANRSGIDSLDGVYLAAVDSVLKAWTTAQAELNRLLHQRIDNLTNKFYRSVALIGALASLSIVLAIMTHRHIVRPLERLEVIAKKVHETKDYGLRIDYQGQDEIGRLAAGFNEMLAELAVARDREISQRLELARAEQLATLGEMTASIAHEINQPLGAIVANGGAALRWLEAATPNLDEVKEALKDVISDGHRASQVIASARAIFKKVGEEKAPIVVNELLQDVLTFMNREVQRHGVFVRSELADGLPRVSGNRVQLQQVIANLIMNAIEAMGSVTDRERILRVASEVSDSNDVLITVEDSGVGLDPKNIDRVFDRFFTTKSEGMGMGLAICRSIVEAHGGRLWAESKVPHGAILRIGLPTGNSGSEP